jgi:hypothetical protein
LTVSAWLIVSPRLDALSGSRLEAGLDQPVVAPASEDRE